MLRLIDCPTQVSARGLRWTITDTCLSSDQKFLLYASISSTVHLVGSVLRALRMRCARSGRAPFWQLRHVPCCCFLRCGPLTCHS